MVGRGNDDRGVVEHAAKIAHGMFRAGTFPRFPATGLIRVAYIGYIGNLFERSKQTGALASATDDPHR
jgi:hypothetical protein